MDTFMHRIEHYLTTAGVYANHHTLQFVAWNLERTIVIHDIFDSHKIELMGHRPWSDVTAASMTTPIHIAYRRHRTFSKYNSEYKAVGKVEGHYWAVIQLQPHPVQALPTHNSFQPLLDIVEHPTMGNIR